MPESTPPAPPPRRKRGPGRPRIYMGYATRYGDRPTFDRLTPMHITLKVDPALQSLRRREAYEVVQLAMTRMVGRDDFRIVRVFLEPNTVHLLVEATSHEVLANGMKSFESSAAQRLNQLVDRNGRVVPRNYHARVIKNPTMAHHAMTYVLGGSTAAASKWSIAGTPPSAKLLQSALVDPSADGPAR